MSVVTAPLGVGLPAAAVPIWADSPAMDRVREAARNRLPFVDVAVSGGARAFVVAGLAEEENRASARADRPSRPILLVTATTREADDLAEALGCLLPRDRVATFPSWETLPHERLSPRSDTVGRRLAVLRRLSHPDPTTRPTGRCPSSSRPCERSCSPWPEGSATWHRSRSRPGDEAPPRGRRRRPGRGRLHAHRPGRAAGRVRRARRHPRRLPAHRGASGPGRVLGRHGRGDPLVQGGRPAQPRDRPARSLGPAVPRAPPHRRRPQRARRLAAELPGVPTCWPSSPRASPSRAWSRSCPSSGRPAMESVLDLLPSRTLVVLVDPERVRTRAHDLVATSTEFLEASWVNAAAGNAVPVDLQSVLGTASYWTLAEVREHARAARPAVVDADLVRQRRRAGGVQRARWTTTSSSGSTSRTTDVEPFRGDTERRSRSCAPGSPRVAHPRRHRRPRSGQTRPRGPGRARRRGHARPVRARTSRPASST